MDFEVMHAGRGSDRTPTRAELLALVERMDARAKEMQRDTITQGHELGRFAREIAALLGGCDE